MVSCTQPLPLSDLNISNNNNNNNNNNNSVFQSQLYRMEFHFFNIGEKEPLAIYSPLYSILKKTMQFMEIQL